MARQTGLVPAMRYRDVPGTVDWLCKAFGCTPLRYGFGCRRQDCVCRIVIRVEPVAIGPVKGSAFDHLMVQPDHIGGVVTQCSYLIVADADAHCARAKAAGADIVLPPDDDGHGARFMPVRIAKDICGPSAHTIRSTPARAGGTFGWFARAAR